MPKSPGPKTKVKKSYKQHCGLARALDVVGGRWTLLIVRELLLGPRRYNDLLENLSGMTTNLLASRLKYMLEHGILEKVDQAYCLTQRGWELEPVVLALGKWGQPFLVCKEEGHRKNVDWAMVSLKRRYDRSLNCCAEIRIDSRLYSLRCSSEKLDVRLGNADSPDLVLSMSEEAFFQLFMLRKDGVSIKILGSEALWAEFCAAFQLRG